MVVSVTLRNTENDSWQKEYVEDKMRKLNRYADSPADVHVVLSVEKFRNVAEINFTADGLNIIAKEEEKDMRLAIDNAIAKIERQLKKHKAKIRTHKNNSIRVEGVSADELPDFEQETLPGTGVVDIESIVLEPMSLDDAMFRIEAEKNRFVLYRDWKTRNVNVLYRRDDGRLAVIETRD